MTGTPERFQITLKAGGNSSEQIQRLKTRAQELKLPIVWGTLQSRAEVGYVIQILTGPLDEQFLNEIWHLPDVLTVKSL